MVEMAEQSAVTRRLGSSVLLTNREVEYLEDMQSHHIPVKAGNDFLREGDEFSTTFVMRSGWAIRYRLSESGKRQIISFVLPGDVMGLHVNYERRVAYSFAAVSDLELALIEPIRVIDLYRNHPVIASGLDWMTVTSFNIVAEHTVSLGVRPARQRILHLLLELYCRLMFVGEAREDGYDSPLTQVLIADTLGLTSVYVSKCLTRLRAEGLAELHAGTVRFPDIERTLKAADFDPVFLEPFRTKACVPNAVREIAAAADE